MDTNTLAMLLLFGLPVWLAVVVFVFVWVRKTVFKSRSIWD